MRFTQKQERFALNLFKGMSQREAYIQAGYSSISSLVTIDRHASDLANNGKVLARLAELRKKAEDASVMNVLERKQRLSEIGRARVTDFTEADENGARIKVDLKSANSGALQEVTTEELNLGKGKAPVIHITRLKLYDPVHAIQELNKMDGIYEESPRNPPVNVNVENRIINFNAQDVAQAIIEAGKLGIPPALLGGHGQGADAAVLPAPADPEAVALPEPEH